MESDELRRLGGPLMAGRWFSSLPTELQRLILSRSRVRLFARGQVVNLEGHAPAGLGALLEGQVSIVRHAGVDDEALIYVGGPGFWFGEFAVLTDASPALVSVIARSNCRILVLPKPEFDAIVRDEPRYYREFNRLAMARYAVFLKAYAQVSSLSPEARLRGQLALLTEMKLDEQSPDAPIDLSLSQTDLAEIVGLSRQTINPMLGALAEQGLIALGFRRIRVLRPAALFGNDRPLSSRARRGRPSAKAELSS